MASVLILVFVGFSWVGFGPVLGLLAVVVFFLALNTYFLPVTYTFDDKGIEVDKRVMTTRYEWKQFRRWFRTSGGIVVSPFSHKSYLDNFRGVHLLLPAGSNRMTNDKVRMTNEGQQTGERGTTAVRTADIVVYLEKRFAPPPVDERLKLDDEPGDAVSPSKEETTADGADDHAGSG